MDIKDLNKSQLILLAVLLSFITSIATGITTVTLMQQAPESVTVPITRVVRETVEKIVPAENSKAELTEEQKKLLASIEAFQALTVTLVLKDQSGDKVLGTGIFLGDDKAVISSAVPAPEEGQAYAVKSALGERAVLKTATESGFTIVELASDGTGTEIAPAGDAEEKPSEPESR